MKQNSQDIFSFAEKKRDLPRPPGGSPGTTNHLSRIWLLKRHYLRLIQIGLRSGERAGDILRKQFPFVLPDPVVPPRLSVEITNICNLRCPYCTSPLKLRPSGMMAPQTFSNLVKGARDADIRFIALVGTGEPTLHPDFPEMVHELARATRVLSVTSNWQRVNEELVRCILTNVKMLTISVDGATSEQYERSRLGGDFNRLLNNLHLLKRVKSELKSKTYVNIRVMLRPSDESVQINLMHFWREFGDVVSKQFVTDFAGVDDDVYALECARNRFPRCTLPFKQLEVHWNGNVPLCPYSHLQTGTPEGLSLGNLNNQTLAELWNGSLMKQYREGHRKKNTILIPVCRGCTGC